MVRIGVATVLMLASNGCELLVDDGARRLGSTRAGDDAGAEGATADAGESPGRQVGATADAGEPDAAPGPSAGCHATCVASPPANWQGPYAIYEGMGSPLPTPPDCTRAGAYSTDAYDGTGAPEAGPAQCSCECGAVTGASCESPVINLYSDRNCAKSCPSASQVIGSSCTVLDVGGCGGLHFTLSPGAPSGACAPAASKTLPAIAWQTNVRLCGLPSSPPTSGCEAGRICAPSTGLPFESAYCVAQAGDWACPSSYPARRTFHASAVDSRACSSCTCNAPTGIQCTAAVSTFGDANCSGGVMMESAPAACSGGGLKAAMAAGRTATGGSCAPSGGVPMGTVTPATPTTVCCTM